jgi:UDP-N-acetylglucosamine 3-dehydrogenase
MAGSLNVGIVGLGHLHPRLYMPLFESVPDLSVKAAAESDEGLLESFCSDFGVKGYPSLEEMLDGGKLDIAAIFLPHAECPEAAQACAEKRIHLMVEKPMAASAEGAATIVEAAREAKVKLTTGYCWRLHPAAVALKRVVRSGVLGNIVGGEGRCAAGRLQRYIDGNASWMLQREISGGGPMYNLGVHWIDLFRWALEDEVAEVCGRNVKVNAEYDIEDNSFAHLRFSKGAIVALDISYTVPDSFPHGRDLYVALRGTRGVVSWAPAYEGEKDVLFICSDDPSVGGVDNREFELEPTQGYSGYMGREYVRLFTEAIVEEKEPPITGEDGVAALKVVEAIYASAAKKGWTEVAG